MKSLSLTKWALAATLCVLALSLNASAASAQGGPGNQPRSQEVPLCANIENSVRQGQDERQVARQHIEVGDSACLVVKCAIKANGDLRRIIAGAIEAGAPADVVARCAVGAGAPALEVARILETTTLVPSHCYYPRDLLPSTELSIDLPELPSPVSQSSFTVN